MKYETITNADDVVGMTLRDAALAAERDALIAEHEAIFRSVSTSGFDPAMTVGVQGPNGQLAVVKVRQWKEEAEVDAQAKRSRANRKRSRAEVSDDDIARARISYLRDERLSSLEREHQSHAIKLMERQSTLGIPKDDPNAPTEEERARMEAEVKDHKVNMARLDDMHAIAKAQLRTVLAEHPNLTPDGQVLPDEKAKSVSESAAAEELARRTKVK